MSRLDHEEEISLNRIVRREACNGRHNGLRIECTWVNGDRFIVTYGYWFAAAYCNQTDKWFVRETNNASSAALNIFTASLERVTLAEVVTLDVLQGISVHGYPYVVKRRMGIVA